MRIAKPYKDDQIIINSRTVDELINMFIEMIRFLGLPLISTSFTDGIELIFSDQVIETQEYQNDFEFIKKEIVEMLPYEAKAIANNCRDAITLRFVLEGRIESSLYNQCKEKLNDAIQLKNYSSKYKAGDYSHRYKRITLYYKVIINDTYKGKSRIQAFEEVFIHELFHAYHYAIAEQKRFKELNRRTDYTSRVVKESLAAYFELEYCKQNGIDTSIKDDWDISPYMYPYAGAKMINNENINNIFSKSCENLDDALRTLLDEDEFYDVKNAREYRERIVFTPPKKSGSYSARLGAPIGTIPMAFPKTKRKNKDEVFEVINKLDANGKLTKHIADLLSDESFTHSNFGISKFPVLKEKKSIASEDNGRYYVYPIVAIADIEYRVVNHWLKDSLELFKKWADDIIKKP